MNAKMAVEPEGVVSIAGENHDKNESQIKKITMNILNDQRKRSFAQISLPRLTDGARRWVCPKCFVICTAIVIAGDAETTWSPQDQHGCCDPCGHPCWVLAEPRFWRRPEQLR